MTTAFTGVYPLAATPALMGMSAKPDDQGLPVNLAGGRGTRIPDLRLLLAVHAARQATGPTVRLVRASDLPVDVNDDAARLTLMFALAGGSPAVRQRAAGSFNAGVAARLARGADGEGEIYSGS